MAPGNTNVALLYIWLLTVSSRTDAAGHSARVLPPRSLPTHSDAVRRHDVSTRDDGGNGPFFLMFDAGGSLMLAGEFMRTPRGV